LHEPSSDLAVVVLADADDVGVARLVASLARRAHVSWWRFGLPESALSAHLDDRGFLLEQPGASLSSAELQRADIVIYRRRLLQPRPLVASELPSPADRSFSEREWTSLIDGLLLAEARRGGPTWLNQPSATLVANNKLALLLIAARSGLPVPPFSVSTPVRPPSARRQAFVTKAISADEQIDDVRYLSTALVPPEHAQQLWGEQVSTPALLQEYVAPSCELRVFYMLGDFLCLALTPSREHVDIRHAPRASLSPRVHDLSVELREALDRLARSFALGYCTFDLIVPDEGSPVLVDITPNGDWDYFESDANPIVTEFLVDTIVDGASRRTRERE
jgi:hypothetical protein